MDIAVESAAPAPPAQTTAAPTDPREAFVLRHQAGVWRHLRFLGADAALAEELALEVLWQALGKRLWRSDPAAARQWLRKAARSVLVSHRRREARRSEWQQPVDDVDPSALAQAWDELGDDGDGALGALRHCLQALGSREREAVELRYSVDGSRAALAERLQVSVAGAKQLLRRVRAKLRVCVENRLRNQRGEA